MEVVVAVLNKIQAILSHTGLTNSLEMPQLISVGSQSSGKSSVLESIIGQDFLPRGSGIVTRTPIILQLHNIPKGKGTVVEFPHQPGQTFDDIEKVRKEIEDQTSKLAGQGKGISDTPIIVKYFSPDVVNLTLVDLPGLTKIPVGEQPNDIGIKIREMIMKYAVNPNSIILAVTSANVDLANSDSLQLAREVDPEGNRTIGVLTKLDLMDDGTDCIETLNGKLYKLNHGYIGVVCRKQKDLDAGKNIKEAIEDEKIYFENHVGYSKYADRLGVPYLINTLNSIFLQHVKKCLPGIRENINKLLREKEREMTNYGELHFNYDDKNAMGFYLLYLFRKFSKAFESLVNGTSIVTNTKELSGGARINHFLINNVKKWVDSITFDILSDKEILTVMMNSGGLNSSLFVPELAFQILCKQQIARFQEPAIETSHIVYDELKKILYSVNIPEIRRFTNLNNKIYDVISHLLTNSLKPTDEMIKNLLSIELGYININHPDFIGTAGTMMQEKKGEENQNNQDRAHVHEVEQRVGLIEKNKGVISEKMSEKKEILLAATQASQKDKLNPLEKDSVYDTLYIEKNQYNQFESTTVEQPQVKIQLLDPPSKKESLQVDMLRKLVTSYINVVKKTINDLVIKAVMTLLIQASVNASEQELITQLYKEELYEELLAENELVAQNRAECKKTLNALRNCANVLLEFDSKL